MKDHNPDISPRLLVLPEPGFTPDELTARLGELADWHVLCHEKDAAALSGLVAGIHAYAAMNLCPCREDLESFRDLTERFPQCTLLHRFFAREPNHFSTALRLIGFRHICEINADEQERCYKHGPRSKAVPESMLFAFGGGIGNAVLASCVAASAAEQGVRVFFCPMADISDASLGSLFVPSPQGVTVIAPGEVTDIDADISINVECHSILRTGDYCHNPYRLGASGHGPAYLADFVRNVTGLEIDLASTFVGGGGSDVPNRMKGRVVVCPGSKPGWDSKRWPHMDALLKRLDNPIVLCREPDLEAYEKYPFLTPISPDSAEFVTDFSLPQVAELLRSASAVVANDCGLAHVAAATGTPTLFLFGPSSLEQNFHPRDNVLELALDMECRPCQGATEGPGRLAPNDYHCDHDFACLGDITVDMVLEALQRIQS